jgi:hypothetical protein
MGEPESGHLRVREMGATILSYSMLAACPTDDYRPVLELEPGLFFTCDGEPVDFNHPEPTWRNIRLERVATPAAGRPPGFWWLAIFVPPAATMEAGMNHKVSPNCVQRTLLLAAFLGCPCSLLAQNAPGPASRTINVKVIDNLIVMPGYVNDSGKLNVVLDTGTVVPPNVLSPDCASKLKLVSTRSAKIYGIGSNVSVPLVSNVHLSWGNNKQLSLKDQQIGELPIAYISQQTGYPVDGIFGSSLFAHFDIRVDYERSAVTFSLGDPSSTSGTPIPIKLQNDVPFVEAKIETADGKAIPSLFLVDSGTTGALILSSKYLDAHPSIAQGHVYHDLPSITAVGGAIELRTLRVTGIDLGPFRLSAPVAAVPREARGILAMPGLAGFIGAGILSRFTVDWNYAHTTMTLTPNHLYGTPFEGDRSGLKPAPRQLKQGARQETSCSK